MRFAFSVMILLILDLSNIFAFDFKPIQYPGSTTTLPLAIEGNTVVGQYSFPSNIGGGGAFIYDGTAYSTFDVPGYSVQALTGINGSNLIGTLYDPNEFRIRDFLYDGTSIRFIDAGGQYPDPSGIDGNLVVGNIYRPTGGFYAYAYDGSEFKYFDYPTVDYPPGTYSTVFIDVDDGIVLGAYQANSVDWQSFLYDGNEFTPLSIPTTFASISALALDKGLVVGVFEGSGFYFDGMTMTKFSHPDGWRTEAYGISGKSIIGVYYDSFNVAHGFLLTIPEPGTLILSVTMLSLIFARRPRRR